MGLASHAPRTTDELGEAGRAELFEQLAELVDECLDLERRAVALLA